MKTNRTELIKILNAVRPAIAARDIVEQSTSFLFIEGRVLAYNDAICVSHPVDINLLGAVAAKELIALLTKLSDDEIDLETTDSELIIVYGAGKKAGIRLEAKTNIDEIMSMLGLPEEWHPLPKLFQEAVNFCSFSTSKNMNKPLLTTIYCGQDTTISSDDNRITICKLGVDAEGKTIEDVDIVPFCLPAAAAKDLKSFDVISYAFTPGWVHFKTEDDVQFSSRVLVGKYPHEKIQQIVDGIKGESVKLPAGLVNTLERTGIFTASDRVSVSIAEGFMTVRGEGNMGWCEEESRIRYAGPNIQFEVSPDFLKTILQYTQETVVGDNVLKFSGQGFVHVMAVKPQVKR